MTPAYAGITSRSLSHQILPNMLVSLEVDDQPEEHRTDVTWKYTQLAAGTCGA